MSEVVRKYEGAVVAEGFTFAAEEDARLAEEESKKIAYLKKKIDFDNLSSVARVYNKLVKENVFKTTIGLSFICELKSYLVNLGEEDALEPVPINMTYLNDFRKNVRAHLPADQSSPIDKRKQGFRVSIGINIVLILAVIALIYIALTSNQPNILNYESALINRYAHWEQELTERENAIREFELKNKILYEDTEK